MVSPGVLKEYENYLISQGYSPATRKLYLAFARQIDVSSPASVSEFVAKYRLTRSQKSTNTLIDSLRNFARFAFRRNLISKEVFDEILALRKISSPQEVQKRMAYSIEEARAILETTPLRWQRHMFWFSMNFGLRFGELRKLRIHHVDLERRLVFIPSEISKSKESRRIRILYHQEHEIEAWLKYRELISPKTDHYIVTTRGGSIESWNSLSTLCRQIESKLADRFPGIRVMMHNFRYTYATRLWQYTGDLYLVQKMLGHQSPETTIKYLRLRDEDLLDIYEVKAGGVRFT